jgi:hypothetical protein
LSSTHLSSSSWCSSWHRGWTLLFWDLVKPSRHHCGLGFLYDWLDSSSSWRVCQCPGARHMISSSGTREFAISSSRLFDFSLTRPPSRPWTMALPPSRSWTETHWFLNSRWSPSVVVLSSKQILLDELLLL